MVGAETEKHFIWLFQSLLWVLVGIIFWSKNWTIVNINFKMDFYQTSYLQFF